ncbi:MAG: carbon-nitrogen hydrolase family protein [Syntrophomonas sp.]
MATDTLRLSILQMQVGLDKNQNLDRAALMVEEAASHGAQMVVLPEIFNSPYIARCFPEYAESYPGKSTNQLSELARRHSLILVGGSIPERDSDGALYNTSFIFGPDGTLIGRHRKIHLFDVDIPGKMTFQESVTLSPGNELQIIAQGDLRFAVMICYDVRFPELARQAALQGVHLLVIPAAFSRTTGSLHWDILMRGRAVDNQVFVAAAAPAFNPQASYQTWGHSMIVDPWGKILAQAADEEELLIVDLDLSVIDEVRSQIPVLKQRRTDLYELVSNLGSK